MSQQERELGPLVEVFDLEGKGTPYQIRLTRNSYKHRKPSPPMIVDGRELETDLREEVVGFLLSEAERLQREARDAIRLAIRLTALAPLDRADDAE